MTKSLRSPKFLLLLLGAASLLLIASPLHAQSGCADSPENPTLVLAAVGSVGGLFSTLRARAKARRNRSQQ